MNKLALGTAQFGSDYGVANKSGQVSISEARKILDFASSVKINTLDTAINYGVSEQILGEIGISGFNVVTKLPSLPEGCSDIDLWIEELVIASMKRLGVSQLYGLLLHRPENLLGSSGAKLIAAINRIKSNELVQNFGVSIYSPSELSRILDLMRIDIVQAPLSIIDRRLESSGWLSSLYQNGIKVHTRSAFLQGLLLMPQKEIPPKFDAWRSLWDKWFLTLDELNITQLEACLSYPLSLPQIERVVVGVDTLLQLRHLVESSQSTLQGNNFTFMSSEDQRLINPSNWNRL